MKIRVAILVCSLNTFASLGSADAQTPGLLPLGPSGLPEKVSSEVLAPGLTLTHVVRGQVSPQDGYEVIVPFNTDQASVQAAAAALKAAGFSPEIINIAAPEGAPPGFFGAIIRLAVLATQNLANALVSSLASNGFTNITTDYTGFDGFELTTGPWVVNILELDPTRFRGTVTPVRSSDPEGRETTSSIAARTGAFAAVNGGYFVIPSTDGTPGAPVGLSAIGGQLYHEADEGRVALGFLPNGYTVIDKFQTVLNVRSAHDAPEQIYGSNRRPGIQRDCGGPAEELPSNMPRQDFDCTLSDDLVIFTPAFGPTTDAGSATVEAVLDSSDRVISVTSGGNVAIPANGSVLAALGTKATWLSYYAHVGKQLFVERKVLASDGVPLPPALQFNTVNGGPHFVEDGQVSIDTVPEGFAYAQSGNGNEYYGFGLTRNPRTLAGRTKDGHLILVTVDGRQPGYSIGLSFAESAALMKSLGSDQAMNLDGGGSTTIAVNGKLFNQPSDLTGERPVGEAIVIKPQSVR